MTCSHECTNTLTERVAVVRHELCAQVSTHDLTGSRGTANCSSVTGLHKMYAMFVLPQPLQRGESLVGSIPWMSSGLVRSCRPAVTLLTFRMSRCSRLKGCTVTLAFALAAFTVLCKNSHHSYKCTFLWTLNQLSEYIAYPETIQKGAEDQEAFRL